MREPPKIDPTIPPIAPADRPPDDVEATVGTAVDRVVLKVSKRWREDTKVTVVGDGSMLKG
jgi:hypothetical protein